MQFNYYYGSEAEQFNFIKVPKMMIKDAAFASLSLVSKLLYGLLLDRMNLSMKNKWLDDENRVYIIYQISEIMDDLNVSKRKAIDYLQELEEFGLVEKKRRGFGLPSLLYVKNFIFENEQLNRGAQSDTSRSSHTDTSRSEDFVTSRSAVRELPEASARTPYNNTKENYINMNNTYSYPINSHNEKEMNDWMDEIKIYEDYLTDQLEIDLLCERYPNDKEAIIGMYDLVLEILVCKNDTIHIAGSEFPSQVVKSRFMKLDSSHIEYVLSCLKANTTKVGNIKKYLLTSLYNAPATMQSFYQAEFNHDMPQYVT